MFDFGFLSGHSFPPAFQVVLREKKKKKIGLEQL